MVTTIIVIVVVLLLLAAFRLWLTANRLDRLHVRTQAAWAALEGALARRIVAARALASTGQLDPGRAGELRSLAGAADTADRESRDAAETALSRALAAVPPEEQGRLAGELTDAAERVLLARRFYNDAVRDTRALRASWFTRFFRLAGRALLPDYFELPEEAGVDAVRRAEGRVLLVDVADRVLLARIADADGSARWTAPGSQVTPGEDLVGAALRGLAEWTGLRLRPTNLVGPIWRCATSSGDAGCTAFFFVALGPATPPPTDEAPGPATPVSPGAPASGTAAPSAGDQTRWLTADELAHLPASEESVCPTDLATRLAQAVRFARTRVAPDIPEWVG